MSTNINTEGIPGSSLPRENNPLGVDAMGIKNGRTVKISLDVIANNAKVKWYSTRAILLKERPNPQVGETAWIGEPYPGVVYKCESVGIWIATTEVPDVGAIDLQEYVKKDEVSILQNFSLKSNDNYLVFIIDDNNNFLWGINREGKEVSPLKDEDLNNLFSTKINIADVLQIIQDGIDETKPISAKALLSTIAYTTLKYINNADLQITVDGAGSILSRYTSDGTFEPAKLRLPDNVLNEIKTLFNDYPILNSLMYVDRDSLITTLDAEGRILSRYALDGTFEPAKLKLPDSTIEEIKSIIGGVATTDHSKANVLQLPFPRSLSRVDIVGSLTGITKEDSVRVYLEYQDYQGNYFRKAINLSYQGTSSMAYEKKNFAFDLLNDDGSSFKLKIGSWTATDSFHLKANYIDALHNMNIGSARLIENMYLTRPFGQQRPWSIPYIYGYKGSENNDGIGNLLKNQIDSGALAHIDGFPIEIYINGEYMGLYTWNLKKYRDNYMMEKDNPLHIQLELSGQSLLAFPVDWSKFEVRNPKMKNMEGQSLEAGQEPENGITKDAINRFMLFCKDVKTTTSKTEFKEYCNIPFWIDFYVFCEMTGNFDAQFKNTQFCTWDGSTWSPLLYDLDSLFGRYWNGVYIAFGPNNPNICDYQNVFKCFSAVFADEIKLRYKELRDRKVFESENIAYIYSDLSLIIGEDAYKRDRTRWKTLPNARANNVNVDNWKMIDYYGNIPTWNATTDYKAGDRVRMDQTTVACFEAINANKGVPPVEVFYNTHPNVGGFYASIEQIHYWISERIKFLDNKFNYNL